MQEIFLKMFLHLDQYRGVVPFERWVSRIAMNHCINALVFGAGGVVGGVSTHYFIKRVMAEAFDFDRWPDRGVRMLDERLGLTEEQRIRVRPVQERLAHRMKEHFKGSLEEAGGILMEAAREVDVELTVKQRVIHGAMIEEMREAFRRHFEIELTVGDDDAGVGPRERMRDEP